MWGPGYKESRSNSVNHEPKVAIYAVDRCPLWVKSRHSVSHTDVRLVGPLIGPLA